MILPAPPTSYSSVHSLSTWGVQRKEASDAEQANHLINNDKTRPEQDLDSEQERGLDTVGRGGRRPHKKTWARTRLT